MKTTKIAALMVVALFILSIIPATIADAAEEATKTKVPKTKDNPIIATAKEKLEQAKEKYLSAKEEYSQARERYSKEKESVLQTREKVGACKGQSDECKQLKKELRVGVRNHLARTSELITKSLRQLTSKINDYKTLTPEEKEEALAQVTLLEEKLTTKKNEIEALGDEVTSAELKEKIKELKTLWQEVRKEQRWIITQLINNRLGNIVEKHNEYYNAMQVRISNLEQQGASEEQIAELEGITDKFKSALNELKAKQEEAEAAWTEAKQNRDKLDLAKEKHRAVKGQIKETKQVMREFMQEFKSIKQEMKNTVTEETTTAEAGTTAEE